MRARAINWGALHRSKDNLKERCCENRNRKMESIIARVYACHVPLSGMNFLISEEREAVSRLDMRPVEITGPTPRKGKLGHGYARV